MIHILIVDDDSVIRAGLCGLIGEYCAAEYQVHEAANGWKGIEQVCSFPIDLIFADIKMPQCDGIQMLDKLSGMGYEGDVVMVSGFDDFTFVRAAMRRGAVDYLLKPIVPEEFKALLHKCTRDIETRQRMNSTLGKARIQCEWELLLNEQHTVRDLLAGAAPASPAPGEGPAASAALFLVDAADLLNQSETGRMTAFLQIRGAVSALADKSGAMLLQGEYERFWAILLLGESPCPEGLIEAVSTYLRRGGRRFAMERGFPAAELSGRYTACVRKLHDYFYDIEFARETACPLRFPYAETVAAVTRAVCDYDTDAMAGQLAALFAAACRERPPVEDFKQLLSGIVYSVMSMNNHFIAVISKYKFTGEDIIDAISEAVSAYLLRQRMLQTMELYVSQVVDNLSGRDDFVVQKAKEYIGREFMNEISLADVAQSLALHPNYFSSLFKLRTGQTYRQYLRQVRINEAKRLIRETNRKFYEIAERVGYHDNTQFYRAFKEETGFSPAEYKNGLNVR